MNIVPPAQKALLLAEDETISVAYGGLSLHRDFCWHWRHRSERFFELLHDVDSLARENFALFSEPSDCANQEQPVWNMDPNAGWEPPSSDLRTPIERCAGWRMELLAYYAPASFNTTSKEKYGIHLTRKGIAKVVMDIEQRCPGQPREVILLVVIYLLFAHEASHAWIEDHLSKQSGGIEAYKRTQTAYHGYIKMEEALCNTWAFAFLKLFLVPWELMHHQIQCVMKYDRDQLIKAIFSWMREQPAGYRDFMVMDVTVDPFKKDSVNFRSEATILIHLGRMLNHIYCINPFWKKWLEMLDNQLQLPRGGIINPANL